MKTKRWIAALLCFLLIGSLFPVSALAAGGGIPGGTTTGYSLTLDENWAGGTSRLFSDITTYKLPSVTRPGETFYGWAESPRGSVKYHEGDMISLAEDTTLYAKWVETYDEYTITFNANGGTGTMNPITVNFDEKYIIPECTFKRNAYFLEWRGVSESGTATYKPGDELNEHVDITLYAIWLDYTFTAIIQNDGNGEGMFEGGGVLSQSRQGYEEKLVAVPNPGYHFKEWKVIEPSGLEIVDDKFIMPDANVTIMAIFEADAPTTYDLWVDGDTQVTSANQDDVLGDGTVSYDPATNTLTLSGYDGSRIKANMTLNIVLADGTENSVSIPENLCGIYTYGSCTLSGKGNLDIHSTGDGIYANNGNLTVNISGDLSVSSDSGLSSDGYITISGSGNVVIDAKKYGLWPDKDVTISGSSKLTVTAAQYAVYIDDSGCALLLNGTGTPISLTAGEGYKAVLNDAGDSPVGGTKLANYDVTGAPDTDSVVYTLGIPVTYTVSFNMGGHGDQIPAQTVEEGKNAAKPADPSAEGWAFDGWYADATFSAAFDFNTAITADTTIYAKWKPDVPAAYTIVGYKNEGPDGAIAEVRINGEKVSEKTGTGGTLKIASDAKDVTVEVTFNRGYTFGKWFDSIVLRWGGVQSGSTNIANSRFSGKIDMPGSDWFETEDQELYLIIQTQALPMYDVNVQTDGHGLASADPNPALSGEEVVLTAMPDEGYRFKEWQSEDVVVTDNKFTMPAKAVTVTAVFEAVPSYTMTFEMNGHGKQIPAQTVESGSKATKPTDPTASGWTFDGWYADAAFSVEFDFDTTVINADTTIYAKWTEVITPPDPITYTLTTSVNGGHGSISAGKTGLAENTVETVIFTPEEGYKIDMVTVNGVETDVLSNALNVTMDADKTVVVTYKPIIVTPPAPATYSVTFEMNGHGEQVAAQTVEEGSKAAKPTDPTASGYTFKGWYTDSTFQTAFDFNTAIHADTTLYAKWVSNSVTPTDPTNPKTGDNSHMLLWMMLLAVSGAALTGTAIYSRKRKHN